MDIHMKGKGLTRESIAEAALKLTDEKGFGNYSVRELAEKLGVRAASLYNHIDSVDDINQEVGRLAASKLNEALLRAIERKERDDALKAAAFAYFQFVRENPRIYQTIISLPKLDKGDEGLTEAGRRSIKAIGSVARQYRVSEEDAVHFSRSLRSALHGFATLEAAGYYTRKDIALTDSFQFLVKGFTEWIHRLESGGSPTPPFHA